MNLTLRNAFKLHYRVNKLPTLGDVLIEITRGLITVYFLREVYVVKISKRGKGVIEDEMFNIIIAPRGLHEEYPNKMLPSKIVRDLICMPRTLIGKKETPNARTLLIISIRRKRVT